MPDEEYIKQVFSKYVKVLFVKCCRADRTQGLRSYAFVEYDDLVKLKNFQFMILRAILNMLERKCF